MSRRRIVFRPFSALYFSVLLFILFFVFPFLMRFYRTIMVTALGLPPSLFGAVLFLSLFGSNVNIPWTTIETREPIRTYQEVRFFGVNWRIPQVELGIRETHVMVNVGGAVVPVLISMYLLGYSIPRYSVNLVSSYINVIVVFLIVAYVTNKNSRIIKGLGIATPMFGPPLTTVFAVYLVSLFSPVCCPTQIAYVGGVLGALTGADLMNLDKLPDLGAPVVSIGGAGTFDGIYLTGIISVVLVLLLV